MMGVLMAVSLVFLFKHKTAYEMRISDWSSDVSSSDRKRVLARPSRRIARGIHTRMGFHSRHGPQTCPAAHPIRTGEFHEAHHPPCPARAVFRQLPGCLQHGEGDRKSTRLNSSH